MPAWLAIALKDLRLLSRDLRAAGLLFAMPLALVLVLGVALGQKDDRLRITVVIEDSGPTAGEGPPPDEHGEKMLTWSAVVLHDLRQTAGIRVEVLPSRAVAERLVRRGERAAVLVFGPKFSVQVGQSSFLDGKLIGKPGLNPFFRDGIDLASLDVTVLRDPTQSAAAAVIEQVAQVTLLRVVLPWMIGRAFDEVVKVMPYVERPLSGYFSKYDLRAKTWAKLTKSKEMTIPGIRSVEEEPAGYLRRGAILYQSLVPSNVVLFAFFLVLTCGWLFVAERQQGTLVRLRSAPISIGTVLVGKLVPCFLVSVLQGLVLLLAGKLVFGMNWGPQPWLLVPVVLCTSFAATGLALLVAGTARTESQVAVYGTLVMLALAGLSGILVPRGMMPEGMVAWSRLTPHAWALDAYNQALLNDRPERDIIARACAVLVVFGVVFLAVGHWRTRLD